MQAGFTFVVNNCVGCQACQIACSIENELEPGLSWRTVSTYNPENLENIAHFHMSMACNHCQDAVCVEQCPALAISKNSKNGIVNIDPEKCIGCKFCSWVCPYDAPKFDKSAGIMAKCTLCSHRLEENRDPACVAICPTAALNFEYFDSPPEFKELPGIPASHMKPSVKIIEADETRSLPREFKQPFSRDIVANFNKQEKNIPAKITLSSEWTLVVFSIMLSLLGAIFFGAVLGFITPDPYLFTFSGLAVLALSTIHLGKKQRAYRAVFNWRRSWLSREIIFTNIFIFSAAVFLIFKTGLSFAIPAMISVLLAAYSMDMVYKVIAQNPKVQIHSAQVLLTMLFFTAIIAQAESIAVLLGLLKLVLYINRKARISFNTRKVFTLLRVFPLVIIAFSFQLPGSPFLLVFILIAEVIDRVEFYLEIKIITPALHLNKSYTDLSA